MIKLKKQLENLQADGIKDFYLYCRKTNTSSNYNKKKLDKIFYTEILGGGIDIWFDLGVKVQKHSIAVAMYNYEYRLIKLLNILT